MIKPHSPAWYDRLSAIQHGYYYPWKSKLGHSNGESAYLKLVYQHINSDMDVLDVGCGHGELTIKFAHSCRRIAGYDRVGSYIKIAQDTAQRENIENTCFVVWDSSLASQGQIKIPGDDNSYDMIISRRGPLHWIADARRVAKPGAILIQLNPMETSPPPWLDRLPDVLSANVEIKYHQPMIDLVAERLFENGMYFDSKWTFDVPEWFSAPEELYIRLSWGFDPGDIPSFKELQPLLEKIFLEYAKPEGLALRHRRFLWKVVVDK